MSEQMQKLHDKIAECDREAALRGFSETGFPRLWFSALSRVAGLDLRMIRRKARHPDDGSIPSPVTRDTSPAIAELQQQNDELQAEIARLRDERRWIPVGERLPASAAILASDGDVVVEARHYAGYGWESIGGDELWFTPTHWMPMPAPPTGGEVGE